MLKRIFSFDNLFRIFVVPLLALILVHLVSYEKLPHEPGYQFPASSFLIILMFGMVICEINRFNYRYLNRTLSFRKYPRERILRQLVYNVSGTIISFTLLSLLINGGLIPLVIFLKYLMVVLMISLLETTFFVLRDIYYLYKKDLDVRKPLVIKSGNKLFKIDVEDIAYFVSKSGIVSLVTMKGNHIITHFSSLGEVENQLDEQMFFRLNRQFLVKEQAIKSIKQSSNRKLKVILEPSTNETEKVVVSRYRRNAFRKWFVPVP